MPPRTYAALTSQRIATLQPSLQSLAREHVRRVKNELGLDLYLTQGHRSPEAQSALSSVVTSAKAWLSWHQYGLAYDVTLAGKVPDDVPKSTWEQIGAIGESLGLGWGGRWTSPDRPHFEWHPGYTIRAAYDYVQKTGKIPEITVTISIAGVLVLAGIAWWLYKFSQLKG